MHEKLYNKEIKCPVCGKKFVITKVRAKSCKVLSRDSDFCVNYEELNPLFYDVWVCEHCGYSALSERFEKISHKEAKIILDRISKLWNKRSFSGERDIDTAIEAFKLALLNLQVINARSVDMAKVCLRIGWLYRFKNDETEKEKEFLKFALNLYNKTYEFERFPVDKLDEYTCMYMVAELNRRTDNLNDSIKWFSRLIGSQEARNNPTLIESAREQYSLLKEQAKKEQGAVS